MTDNTKPDQYDALAEMLAALGFHSMAVECRRDRRADHARVYARLILQQLKKQPAFHAKARALLRQLDLVA